MREKEIKKILELAKEQNYGQLKKFLSNLILFNEVAEYWLEQYGLEASEENIEEICVAMDTAGEEKAKELACKIEVL